MNLPRAFQKSLQFLTVGLALAGASCGSFTADRGIPAQALVFVSDSAGNPVSGATVWVPADSGGEAGTDTSGFDCATAPEPALFASCTGPDGIALLQCADGAVFLFKYAKDGVEGSVSGECGKGEILSAPLAE